MEQAENKLIEHENITRLKVGGKNVALIGTAHVSQESADLVKEVIDTEKPDAVCVELCENRYKSMKDRDNWRKMDLVNTFKEKKAMVLVINFLLASYQRKIAKKLGIKPGQEMIQAIESAEENNAQVGVIDRDVRKTISRTWGYMTFKTKFKLFMGMGGLSIMLMMLMMIGGFIASLTIEGFTSKHYMISVAAVFGVMTLFSFSGGKPEEEEEITKEKLEEMKKQDTLELLLQEMGDSVPDIKLRLIDERDLYMVEKIRHIEGDNIVAIVGAGHVPGMLKNWDTKIDIEELEESPKPAVSGKLLKWAIPAIILVIFVVGFYFSKDVGTELILVWILANGICSAIGTAIALGHPLSIITAFIAAPITSLNPAIGAGMVVGFVEAKFRKPTVADLENLPEDFQTARGWWRNKVTRTLLVFIFSGLGSAVGTWVAGSKMSEILKSVL